MVNFTKAQIFEFLKTLGLTEKDFLDDGENFDLFTFVGITPTLGKDGQRELTPYEILRIPPQFENGKEKPIIFKINHRIKKIGNYKGNCIEYINKKKNQKSRDQMLGELEEEYERALFFGDAERAESLILAINEISNEAALKLRFSYFAYVNHYKKMKRQLMQDVFAHFFAVFMANKKSSIKKGLLRKDKKYRPYVIDQSYTQDSGLDQNSVISGGLPKSNFFSDSDLNLDEGAITDVSFQDDEGEFPTETKIDEISDFNLKTNVLDESISSEAIRLNMENIEKNENLEQTTKDQNLRQSNFDFEDNEEFQNNENGDNNSSYMTGEKNKEDKSFFSIIKKAVHFNPIHPKEIDKSIEKNQDVEKNPNENEFVAGGPNQEHTFSE